MRAPAALGVRSSLDLARGGGGSMMPRAPVDVEFGFVVGATILPSGSVANGEERGSVDGRINDPPSPPPRPPIPARPGHAGDERGSVDGRSSIQGERRDWSPLSPKLGVRSRGVGGGGINVLRSDAGAPEGAAAAAAAKLPTGAL